MMHEVSQLRVNHILHQAEPKRLRVLHIGKFYAPVRGGIETYLKGLCDLQKLQSEVEVAVSNRGRKTVREQVDDVPVTRHGTWIEAAGASLSPGLINSIRNSHADLVHLHLPSPVAAFCYLASGRRGPLVLSYHSDIIRQKALGALLASMHERIYRQASAFIAASPDYVESSPILSSYQNKTHVIPYGISLAPFDHINQSRVAEIRSRYKPPIVFAIGRHVYYKGFQYLVQAMASIKATCLLAGDGPLRGALQSEASRLGVADRVHFLGEVEDALPYFQAAELFAFPSVARSEAFGIVQLEAMACSRPVVNTSLDSGVPFVSLHGKTGLTVPPRDIKALADAINLLLCDHKLRETMGATARKRVEQEFTVEQMSERTFRLYHDILGFCAYES